MVLGFLHVAVKFRHNRDNKWNICWLSYAAFHSKMTSAMSSSYYMHVEAVSLNLNNAFKHAFKTVYCKIQNVL